MNVKNACHVLFWLIVSAELCNFMRKKHPVTSPYRTAVYSDGGFAVLAQVLSRMTDKSYEDAVRTLLFEPLGMDDSTFAAPTGSGRNNIDRSLLDTPFTSWGLDVPIVFG